MNRVYGGIQRANDPPKSTAVSSPHSNSSLPAGAPVAVVTQEGYKRRAGVRT